MFTEKILEELRDISDEQKIRKNREYIVGFATFFSKNFEEILKRVEKTLNNESEKIICIGKGEIIDSGAKQFEIKKAVFMEYYDYPSTTAVFIRLYKIRNKKEWISLYIDENPITPWWSEEERENE